MFAKALDVMNMVGDQQYIHGYIQTFHSANIYLCYVFTGALPIPRFSYATKDDFIFATFSQCNGFEESLLNCSFHYADIDDGVDYLVGVRCDGTFALTKA